MADLMYGALPFPVFAQSNSSSAISYSVCQLRARNTLQHNVDGDAVVGVVTLQASQAATGRYAAATVQMSFNVQPIAPSLALIPILPKVYGAAPSCACFGFQLVRRRHLLGLERAGP